MRVRTRAAGPRTMVVARRRAPGGRGRGVVHADRDLGREAYEALGNREIGRLLDAQRREAAPVQRNVFGDVLGKVTGAVKTGASAVTETISSAWRRIMLSGSHWRGLADARGWSTSTSTDDLAKPFGTDVADFVAAMRAAGATVIIEATRRSRERAWLMHHGWRVARGQTPPGDDPHKSGIIWDHGTRPGTRAGAQAMVGKAGFNMAYPASLRSLHISGLAIDMTISGLPEEWTFTRNGRTVTVRLGAPHTGQNPRLHTAARRYFAVKKLVSDPPHWSRTGR